MIYKNQVDLFRILSLSWYSTASGEIATEKNSLTLFNKVTLCKLSATKLSSALRCASWIVAKGLPKNLTIIV